MTITINWITPKKVDQVLLYRSTTKYDPQVLPVEAPLATLGPEATSYIDNSALVNTYYYYLLAYKSGDEIVYSPQSLTINMPYTGPGPQELLRGDWERGYFGEFSAPEMPNRAEITALVKGGGSAYTEPTWLKFIYKGKILFIPKGNPTQSISWNMLYASGLIYGMDSFGPANRPTNVGDVNQRVIYSKGDHDYLVRTPRGGSSDDFSPPPSGHIRGEWAVLVSACYLSTRATPATDWDDIPRTVGFIDNRYTILAEPNGNYIASVNGNTPGSVLPTASTRTETSLFWTPVFELQM